MKEAIEQVLSNEAYTTNEERVEALSKELATLVIPKDKFNEQASRLKKTESELSSSQANLSTLQSEFDEFKKSKMTEDEKKAAEIEEFEAAKKANAVERSSLAVQKLLFQNGIEVKDDDVELKETLETIVSEDYDKSIKLATSFISLLNKTKEQTAKDTTTKLLNETPKPVGGSGTSSSLSNVDMIKKEIEQAIKDKDPVKQTELMTKLYQEEHKVKI